MMLVEKIKMVINFGIGVIVCYLLEQVFWTSFIGARRPLAREPDEEHLNDVITETNFSIDFSAISE
jgi:hypothetical protein